MAITVQIDGLKDLQKRLRTMVARHKNLFDAALDEIGLKGRDWAFERAPKSPTEEQYLRELNLKRLARLVQGKKGRKSESTTKGIKNKAGTLEDSIRYRVNSSSLSADVYVPVNSFAGKYAYTMHESKYNLGPGSRDKQRGGIQVGRKYIERGVDDNQREIGEIIESFVDDMVRIENARG